MSTTPDLAKSVAAFLMLNGNPVGLADSPLIAAVSATSASCATRTPRSEKSFPEFRLHEHQYGQSLVLEDYDSSLKAQSALSANKSPKQPQSKSACNIVQSSQQGRQSNCNATKSNLAKRRINNSNNYNILATSAKHQLIEPVDHTFIETVDHLLAGRTNAYMNTVRQQQQHISEASTSNLLLVTSGGGDQTTLVAPMSASTSNGNANSHPPSSPTKQFLINHAQSTGEGYCSTSGITTIPGAQFIFSSIITTQAKPESGLAKAQHPFSKPITILPSSSSSSSFIPKTTTPVNSPTMSAATVSNRSNSASSSSSSSGNKFLNYHPPHHPQQQQQQQQQQLRNQASSANSSSLVSHSSGLDDQAATAANTSKLMFSSKSGHQSPPSVAGQAANARLMDMGKRLLDAAREGSTDQVRQLVITSGAPFTSDWLGTTALHLAAQNGHAEIAEILLKGGVNGEARTKLERTALHLAAQKGSLEVVDLLVTHGSDVNARDMLRMTPLHWAVERRHARVVERLLLSGADLNAKSKFQLTPIEIAQNSESYEILNLFKVWSTSNTSNDNRQNGSPISFGCNLNARFNEESHDMLDVDYRLAPTTGDDATTSRASVLDIDEPCIDLVELEWNALKFEPDFFLSNDEEDESKVEYLMKIVEELQQENRQLRQRVEQLSTTSQ